MDGGRARYFHGRDAVWDKFQTILKSAWRARGGTVFLVQGPPGAGKTAILHEFADRAEKTGLWDHRRIEIASLHDPWDLADALGDQRYSDRTSFIAETATTKGADYIANYQREMRRSEGKERSGPTPKMLLRWYVAGLKKGLLLTLDEVQNLSAHKANFDRRPVTMDVLDIIRNATAGGPVVLLAGGLGISMSVLGDFGMSRLFRDCLHNIGVLDEVAERNVIRDWIVKGGEVGDKVRTHILNRWIDTIAAETDGWPQHIHCFAPEAARWLRRHGSLMPDAVPEALMERGKADKSAYYAQRVSSIYPPYCVALAALVKRYPSVAGWDMLHIMRAFQEVGLPGDSSMGTFREAVSKGVLAETEGLYKIPIPSMQRWLLHHYGDRG